MSILLRDKNNNTLIYNPDFFTPVDLDDAKRIILGHGSAETPHRWVTETNWNINLFKSRNFINQDSIVLDWGAGIGRLSKALIDTFGCQVVGVDIDQKMREYAIEYVNSSKFSIMSVEDFRDNSTIKFTNAIAVWALQHSVTLEQDLALIKSRLTPDAGVFIFEENSPCVPIIDTDQKHSWAIYDHGMNFRTIDKQFTIQEHGKFPTALNIPENRFAWWGFFKNKS